MIAGLLLAVSFAAQPAERSYETSFREAGTYSNGSANITPVAGGEYAYGKPETDGRVHTKPAMVGSSRRTDFSFFTPAEEQALLAMRDAQLRSAVKERLLQQRRRHAAKRPRLDWPKVVVTESQICVPELANSDSVDWKSYLTCHPKEK